MAQAGFTPISLYYSTTASAVPTAGNLVAGELALNTNDGKLYFKNSSNVVTLLASTSGASGDVVGPASSTANGVALFDGTTGKLIQSPSTITYASSTLTLPSISASGNLTFTGTGNRITGDFNNATLTNRVLFQNSTTNANTVIGVITNGTGVSSQLALYASSDPSNAAWLQVGAGANSGTEHRIAGTQTGTGSFLPITMHTGGSERLRIDTSGNVGIGTSSPTVPLTVGDSTATNVTNLNALFSTNTGTGANIVVRKSNDTAGVTANITFVRSRGTAASPTVVSSGDNISNLVFSAYDGTNYITAAQITSAVDTTPGTNDMPGRLVFFTTADGTASAVERMRIDSSGNVAIGTTTASAQLTVAGSSSVAALKVPNMKEVATISATAATGTINYDITTQSVLYYTSNASANWTVNFRASSGTSLDTLMSTGESMSVSFLVTQGSTAYYNSVIQVDGTTSGVTTKWQGSAPTSGNANSIDSYTYVIMKTGSATFTVLATQTKFA
jgi:hypothetical protein